MLLKLRKLLEKTCAKTNADDITATEIAPKPKKDTHVGVKYCSIIGSTCRVSLIVPFTVKSDAAVKLQRHSNDFFVQKSLLSLFLHKKIIFITTLKFE